MSDDIRDEAIRSLAGALRMGMGAYPSPEAFAEALLKRLDHDGFRIGLMDETVPEDRYLIWSHEHAAWWGPGGNGYVRRLSNAGRYSREAALKICTQAMFGSRGTLNEVPVRLADVTAMVDGFIGTVGRDPDPEREPWA